MRFILVAAMLFTSLATADDNLTPLERSEHFIKVSGDKVFKADGSYSYRNGFHGSACQMGHCNVGEAVVLETLNVELITDNKFTDNITDRERQLGVVRVDREWAYYLDGACSRRSDFIVHKCTSGNCPYR